MKICICWLVSGTLLFVAPAARAACSVTATGVAYGVYNPLSGLPTDGVGTVTLTCSGLVVLTAYSIRLNAGTYGTYAARQMANGGSRLDYNLYTDVAHSQVWGDGSGGTATVDGLALGILLPTSYPHTVYGRISSGQSVSAGSYSDTITVTVNY